MRPRLHHDNTCGHYSSMLPLLVEVHVSGLKR